MSEVFHTHEVVDALGGDLVYQYYAATSYPYVEVSEDIRAQLSQAGILTLADYFKHPEYEPSQKIAKQMEEINRESRLAGLKARFHQPYGRFFTGEPAALGLRQVDLYRKEQDLKTNALYDTRLEVDRWRLELR